MVLLSEDTAGVAFYLKKMLAQRRGDKVVFKVEGVGEGPLGLKKEAKKVLSGTARHLPTAELVLIVVDKDESEHFSDLIHNFHDGATVFCYASNLAFETYFIMHYEPSTRAFSTQESLLEFLRKFDGFESYDKSVRSVPMAKLAEKHLVAQANSEAVREARRQTKAKNPRTDVDLLFLLVSHLRTLGIQAIKNLDTSYHDKFLAKDHF